MSDLERRRGSGGPLEPAKGGMVPFAGTGPARLSYSYEDYGDWSHLVPEMAAAVAGLLVGDRLAAWVNRATTRRRSDDFYQSISAWWASARVVVEVGATRPLAPAGGNRFSPAGLWIGEAVVHQLSPAEVSAKTFARRNSDPSYPSVPAPPSRLVHDSLEVLPEPLRRLTAGGPPAGSLLWDQSHGQVVEEVMAYRVLRGNAVVLFAWRGPSARDALESAIWHSRVLETTVLAAKTYTLRTNDSPMTSPSSLHTAAPRWEKPARRIPPR